MDAHGHRRDGRCSLTYNSWRAMKQRCGNPNNIAYRWYGAEGVTFCERWKVFAHFLEDMKERPSPDYTLDRIDVFGNYEPGNCKWSTWAEQQANRRKKYEDMTLEEQIAYDEICSIF